MSRSQFAKVEERAYDLTKRSLNSLLSIYKIAIDCREEERRRGGEEERRRGGEEERRRGGEEERRRGGEERKSGGEDERKTLIPSKQIKERIKAYRKKPQHGKDR